jgi:signal transduction histidine kinase
VGTGYQLSNMARTMFQPLIDWLKRIPIENPIDRDNAFFMQFFLAFIGCSIPINKALILLQLNWQLIEQALNNVLPWPRVALGIDLSTDVAISAAAWTGVYLIRKGRFRSAVNLFLTVLLGSAVVSYATIGYSESGNDQILVTSLVIAGLMSGRRTLWKVYATIMLAFIVGMTTELLASHFLSNVAKPHMVKGAYTGLPEAALSYFITTIVLDRSMQALRAGLAASLADRRRLRLEIAERERTQEQLLHAHKMEAVGQLAGGIAHDINNVLGIIMGFTRDRYRLDEPGTKTIEDARILGRSLESIELATRRGAAVCRKLLNFSRHDVTHAEIFDAAAALREFEPMLRQLIPSAIRLDIDTPTEILPVHFDRSQFELALLNLASNARDAMPGGGSLTLSAAMEESSVVLSMRDTGAGMTEKVRQHIFEPFFTTKPAGSGTGLGLSVVYGLIHRAGGTIVVESSPGAGTAFYIRLPTREPAGEGAPLLPPPVGAIRVLLIEDDDDLRALLASTLENGGCVVSEAANGAEAERVLANMIQAPQVLVCDHRMPDTDGATLMRKLREQLPEVPAILISAYLETDGSPPGHEDPFSERLPKPFAPDALLMRVIAAASRSHAGLEAASL